jgi:hypothetical protein
MRRIQPAFWVALLLSLSAAWFAACGNPSAKPPMTPDGDNPELTAGTVDAGTG